MATDPTVQDAKTMRENQTTDPRFERGWRTGADRVSIEDLQREWESSGPPLLSRKDAIRRHFHEWHGAAPDDAEIDALLEAIDSAR